VQVLTVRPPQKSVQYGLPLMLYPASISVPLFKMYGLSIRIVRPAITVVLLKMSANASLEMCALSSKIAPPQVCSTSPFSALSQKLFNQPRMGAPSTLIDLMEGR
jgi:hypothetical protein